MEGVGGMNCRRSFTPLARTVPSLQQNLAVYHPTTVIALVFLQILRRSTLRGLSGQHLHQVEDGAMHKFLFVTRNGKNSKGSGATIFKHVVQEACLKLAREKGIEVQVSGRGGGREERGSLVAH